MSSMRSALILASALLTSPCLAQPAPAGHAAAAVSSPAAVSAGPALFAPLSGGEAIELPPLDPQVPRPDAVLGYPLGSRFTPWERTLSYLEALAAASPRVKMWEYGRTYEGRPLELLAFSTPENLAHLDEIRRERLRLADPGELSQRERERLVERLPAVVWLAYGVHGNESSSAEAALAVAYVLAAAEGETAAMLKNVIVLLDPLANPDGHERYVQSYRQRRGEDPNPHRAASEHWEPWPGGRPNHYLIDLNRDWAWASQQETRYRLAAYRAWEPQVYVDFHEMGSNSSYFFPPAAEPIHPRIDRRIVSWLDVFGRGNAEAFDRQGWVYYKSENYDLFYPGYGDSYPGLRGAVGMTYEVAGGGGGGLALALPDGTTLTLADRAARHFTTSLATLKTAARNGRKLLEDFTAGRLKSAAEAGRSYLWAPDQQEARALADLLALHGVKVRQLAEPAEVRVRALRGGEEAPRRFAAGTYVASTAQPLGSLVEALMELEAPMSQGFVDRQRQRLEQNLEAEFYDITAWSLPLAYNLQTWVAAGEPAGLRPLAEARGGIQGGGSLGYLVAPQGLASYRLEAQLQKRRIHHRVALAGFSGADGEHPPGTLYIPRHGNPPNLPELLAELLREGGLTAQAVAASYDFKGLSLGSNQMPPVRPGRTGLLSGEGVDANSFGFLWHLLDQQVGLAHDRIDLARLRQVDLSELSVLVLPSGDYDDLIGSRTRELLDAWVRSGGLLVAVGDAVKWLQGHDMTAVKSWQPPPEKPGESAPESDPEASESAVEKDLARRPIYTPGAVLATRVQRDHPLTLGLRSAPPVLFEGSNVLLATGDPRKDVLTAAEDNPVVAGFAWPEAKERLAGSLLVGYEARGNGGVVLFAQDPAFRLFWHATTPILLNALLYGPTAGLGARSGAGE
jgi:zinc carboxypeptidase